MTHRHDIAAFALGHSAQLGQAICEHLHIPLSQHEQRIFDDGEHKIRPLSTVRNHDVFVIHSLSAQPHQTVNDALCRTLFFIATLRDVGAARVNAVLPYLCYARKDRRTKARDPVTIRYVASLFEAMGVDNVITIDVHNQAAFENAFRCPTIHLKAVDLFVDHFAPLAKVHPLAVISPRLVIPSAFRSSCTI